VTGTQRLPRLEAPAPPKRRLVLLLRLLLRLLLHLLHLLLLLLLRLLRLLRLLLLLLLCRRQWGMRAVWRAAKAMMPPAWSWPSWPWRSLAIC
jgi:hypothetical protein